MCARSLCRPLHAVLDGHRVHKHHALRNADQNKDGNKDQYSHIDTVHEPAHYTR